MVRNNKTIPILCLMLILGLTACELSDKIAIKFESLFNFEQYKDSLQLRDMEQISEAYKENIEYYRMFRKNRDEGVPIDSLLKYHPYSDVDPSGAFYMNAVRRNHTNDEIVACPVKTQDCIEVYVDSIIYSRDKLFAFAYACIAEKPVCTEDSIGDKTIMYNGVALICYRKHISDRFMIYPVLGFSVRDFDSRELVIRTLVRWYKKNIKRGCSVSETVLAEKECKVGLYDPAFFKEAHFFEKNEDGYYLFQMYKYYKTTDSVRKKFIPFPFFSNQPDSIKEKWRYKD